MTNTPGSKTVIVDADALIGLIHQDDLLHSRCMKVAAYLSKNSFASVVPGPIVLEAATTLAKDKTIGRSDLAKKLLADYSQLEDQHFTSAVFSELARIYPVRGSKKNTPFDYFVLTTAKLNQIQVVFSFDRFYKKQGLTLAEDLL